MFSRFAKVALDSAPYFATEACEILTPSFSSSLWIRGAPKEDSHGSSFESDREFPSELEDVRIAHDVLSKSNNHRNP